MKHVTLPGGEVVPSMGQGTWKMGERAERRSDEIAALRAGVELGMTLVDTAEMYGDGAAETLICEALGDRRDGRGRCRDEIGRGGGGLGRAARPGISEQRARPSR